MKNQKLISPATKARTQTVSSIDTYLANGFKDVEGWCVSNAVRFARTLDAVHRTYGEEGGVGEIGVHHGKLFIVLAHLCGFKDPKVAIDVFDRQDLNLDRSGLGDFEVFTDNYHRHYGADTNLHVIRDSSLNVVPMQVLNLAKGPLRLFSIDGGHTAEILVNDLRLAEGVLSPRGFAILDDVFNDWWPGVSEGVYRYAQDPNSKLVPIAISGTKTAFGFREFRDQSQTELRSILGSSARRNQCGVINVHSKEMTWLGEPVVCIRFHERAVAAPK